MLEKLTKAGEFLYGAILKSFRGLVCEPKAGGWEMSKGATMSWLLLYGIWVAVQDGTLGAEWLVYVFGGTMGYNGLKIADIGGAFSKLTGKK
jgi:hypothetical protein